MEQVGWSVVQRDHDEEMRPLHGMRVDADLEVQRTFKRTFLFLLAMVGGSTTTLVNNKGIIDGLWWH